MHESLMNFEQKETMETFKNANIVSDDTAHAEIIPSHQSEIIEDRYEDARMNTIQSGQVHSPLKLHAPVSVPLVSPTPSPTTRPSDPPPPSNYSTIPSHDLPALNVETSVQNGTDMDIDYSSTSQQILLSAAIASLIPKLTSSLNSNADLSIDPTSPEFLAMVSAAATHYANMGIPSVYQPDGANAVINENDSTPSNLIDTENSSQPTPNIPAPSLPHTNCVTKSSFPRHRTSSRLNKFVRRLHDMLATEKDKGIVEWRCGLLILHSTDAFAKKILPKYFNTRNFKTFRRQLNYYGFVHVRSFSATGSATTALWVNQELAAKQAQFSKDCDNISSVLLLKRVDPCPDAKTAEGRRVRKEEAVHTVEDIGINTQWMQLSQIRRLSKNKPASFHSSQAVQSSDVNSLDQGSPITTYSCDEKNIDLPQEFYQDRNFVANQLQKVDENGFKTYSSYHTPPPSLSSFETNSTDSSGPVTESDFSVDGDNDRNMSSCDDAANLLLNLSRSGCDSSS